MISDKVRVHPLDWVKKVWFLNNIYFTTFDLELVFDSQKSDWPSIVWNINSLKIIGRKIFGHYSLVLRCLFDPIMRKFIVQRTFTVSVLDILSTQNDVSVLTHCIFRNLFHWIDQWIWMNQFSQLLFLRVPYSVIDSWATVKITITISRSKVIK